jgi:hypothetical protein
MKQSLAPPMVLQKRYIDQHNIDLDVITVNVVVDGRDQPFGK